MADSNHADVVVQGYAELLSLAAHEFRTPASVLAGYLRMLQKGQDPPLADRDAKMVDEAAKSCARMVALIEELSEVAKLDDGRIGMVTTPMDLFELTAETAGGTHEARDRGVELVVRRTPEAAPILGDANRLRHAFTHFYRAVLREQPTAAPVIADHRLIRDRTRAFALITIGRDSRLDEAIASSPGVFDEARGGLGLALPIARRVVERHGGAVWSPLKDLKEPGVRNAIVVRIPLRA